MLFTDILCLQEHFQLNSGDKKHNNTDKLLKAFGQLKERVLWKWEKSNMKEKPDNVMIKDFLPQQDVLGHPNLKAFVTHAGYLSFEESLCHKVPMVSHLDISDSVENVL